MNKEKLIPASIRIKQEAEREVRQDMEKDLKEKLKYKLREKLKIEQALKNIDREIEDLQAIFEQDLN